MESAGMNLPPTPRLLDYPAATTGIFVVALAIALMLASSRFDPTHGTLTISLLVVLAMIGTTAFSLVFSVPTDEITSAAVGGLVAAFGAVVSYWLTKKN